MISHRNLRREWVEVNDTQMEYAKQVNKLNSLPQC